MSKFGILYNRQTTLPDPNAYTRKELKNISGIFDQSEHNIKRLKWFDLQLDNSGLHYTYSINGQVLGKDPVPLYGRNLPKPTGPKFDMDGKNPWYEYIKNQPPGARF